MLKICLLSMRIHDGLCRASVRAGTTGSRWRANMRYQRKGGVGSRLAATPTVCFPLQCDGTAVQLY